MVLVGEQHSSDTQTELFWLIDVLSDCEGQKKIRNCKMSSPDFEEQNIQEIVGGYYLFFQMLSDMREIIDTSHDIGPSSCDALNILVERLEGNCLFSAVIYFCFSPL